MSPRTRFIIAHPVRAWRFHRAATAPWLPINAGHLSGIRVAS